MIELEEKYINTLYREKYFIQHPLYKERNNKSVLEKRSSLWGTQWAHQDTQVVAPSLAG